MASHRQMQMSRVEVWNSIKPAREYIPGLGRGATGFTTRSDIGPAKFAPTLQSAGDAPKEEATAEVQQFDQFLGNDAGAFVFGEYDDDDKEADEIWNKIEDVMDERRKVQREKREKAEYEQFRSENPLIKEQFADLKRGLAEVSEDEWKGIPEIGDYTIKRRKRYDNLTAASDSLLAGAVSSVTQTDTKDQSAGYKTDLTAVGDARKRGIEVTMDRMADSVSGQTTVDPKGYMTAISSMKVSTAAEVSDIKKARTLMKSMVQSDPLNANSWIAYARLEEIAGNLKSARAIIAQGSEKCPSNEDVWLEAARLQTPDNARALLARGVQHLPSSVKLWMQAARMETDTAGKRRVLRKALERNSGSVRLWKAAVELHEEDEARLLLSRAVECCPDQVDLWIALVRLEPNFEQAKKALNRAVKALPMEPSLYIAAAKLQEAHGEEAAVGKIIARAISRKLPDAGVIIDRETWLREAETCEKSAPPMLVTCRAIVEHVVGMGVEAMERKDTWLRDAEECLRRGSVETARAVLGHALGVFPQSQRAWRQAAALEKAHGSDDSLHALLRRAVTACPHAEVLWLMAAKEKWLAGDVPAARGILEEAFTQNPNSEEILLAAFKLEFESREPERARVIAARARAGSATASARVWMKSAIVARELGRADEERSLLVEGISRFPDAPKLHMMLGQLEARGGNADAARRAYQAGLKAEPRSVPLWKLLARLEEGQGNMAKARAVLEQGRLRNPKNAELWLASVRAEARAGNAKAADAALSRALQDCEGTDGCGALWSEYILTSERAKRKARIQDAVRRCEDDPHVFAAMGRVFLSDRKFDIARRYFHRAAALAPDVGDFWALRYALETKDSKQDAAAEVLAAAKKADPHHGERWCRVSKDPANAHQDFEKVLKLVVLDFETQDAP